MLRVLAGVVVLLAVSACNLSSVEDKSGNNLGNGSFFAQLNEFRIHYAVHGKGPVLMVLPNSWGITVGGLRGLLGALERELTMVYFDPRGMGLSGAIREESDRGLKAVRDDFEALRGHLGLGRVNVIGWSNGAMNLIYLASERTDSLRSAVFLHGFAEFTAEDSRKMAEQNPELVRVWSAYLERMRDETLSDDAKNSELRRVWVEEYLPLSCAEPEEATEMLQKIFRDSSFSWRHAEYSNRESAQVNALEELQKITVPSLVIAGRQDLIPVQKARQMAEMMPDAMLSIFEASGHFSPTEEPEKFREVITEFLSR